MTDKFLNSDVLRLRAVEPSDADLMWQIETDSRQWLDNGILAPYSLKKLRDYAENYDADPIRAGQIRFVVELVDGRRPVGLADLYDISSTNRTAFIGIYIIDDCRGKGLSREALSLLEDYARQLLNLRMLGAKVAEGNTSSAALFSHTGYESVGILPDWLLSGRKTRDVTIYVKKL